MLRTSTLKFLKGAFNKQTLKKTGDYLKTQGKKFTSRMAGTQRARTKDVFAGTFTMEKNIASTVKSAANSRAGIGARYMGSRGKHLIGDSLSSLRRITGNTVRSGPGKVAGRSVFALGAVSMVGLNMMKGGMNAANEIVHERYMQDYTYSKNIMHNSMVGMSAGTNRMLNKGATQGLTLSLHKTRHGK